MLSEVNERDLVLTTAAVGANESETSVGEGVANVHAWWSSECGGTVVEVHDPGS